MTLFSLLATSVESHSHSALDALPYMLGMLLVLISLALLWGICAITARIIAMTAPRDQTTLPVVPPSPAHELPIPASPALLSESEHSHIAPEIVAVIAGAVASITRNRPVRIVSIKPMNSGWERAGRQSVLTSHRIR